MCGQSFEHKSELKAHRRTAHPQPDSINSSIDLAPDMLLVGVDQTGEYCNC